MILELENVHAHYGKSHVLQGVSLRVNDGELVTLLGRNGAGKTTTLKSTGSLPMLLPSAAFAWYQSTGEFSNY